MPPPDQRKKHCQTVGFNPTEEKMEEGEVESSSSEEETYTHEKASSTTAKEEEETLDTSATEATADPLDNLDLPAIGELCQETCG
ncbi:unnamed protein product [Didymodactylos carnosus]|uniref:Uncharacterized protein n=1 Tax=Didymodactylos carnosus TaxID=1234261 RepID=A0A815USA8_9BILA|nr:unnamed protein product [Didymodactylos carnosus]CAF4385912.1 unnamed protein product [Didymodactylos carnosus]